MIYTFDKLEKTLNRSETFIRTCLMRYGIEQKRSKTTKKIVFDIPKDKMKSIIEFSQSRKVTKRRKMNVKREIDKLIEEAKWKLEALPEKYFAEYFEEEFIGKLQKLTKNIKVFTNQE